MKKNHETKTCNLPTRCTKKITRQCTGRRDSQIMSGKSPRTQKRTPRMPAQEKITRQEKHDTKCHMAMPIMPREHSAMWNSRSRKCRQEWWLAPAKPPLQKEHEKKHKHVKQHERT